MYTVRCPLRRVRSLPHLVFRTNDSHTTTPTTQPTGQGKTTSESSNPPNPDECEIAIAIQCEYATEPHLSHVNSAPIFVQHPPDTRALDQHTINTLAVPDMTSVLLEFTSGESTGRGVVRL